MSRLVSRGCRPIEGSSSTYSVPTSPVPRAVASAMRWASPPDSVPNGRLQRQVVETHVGKEAEAALELADDLPRHQPVAVPEPTLEALEQGVGLPDGLPADLVDGPAADAHAERLPAQPAPRAGRARLVSAVAAQEHADLDLVLLRLEPAEEAHHAGELLVALEDEAAVLLRERAPGHVERDAPATGEPPQLGERAAVVGLVPGLDRAAGEALRLVGDDELLVDLDEVPEAVAGRAGSEGVVEREEPGLRFLEGPPAARAVEPLPRTAAAGRPPPAPSPARLPPRRPSPASRSAASARPDGRPRGPRPRAAGRRRGRARRRDRPPRGRAPPRPPGAAGSRA